MAVSSSPPHFAAPTTLDATGKFRVVDQDSRGDVAACIYNAMVCPQGAKLGDPRFGTPSPLFQTIPLNTSAILAALQRVEPRADLSITEHADAFNAAVRDITVRAGVAG